MSKFFNISADCKTDLHYMVNIDSRLQKIKEMVDQGNYFMINRARQYGKTTILRGLGHFLKEEYVVVSLDFQMMGAAKFANENTFSLAFAKMFLRALENNYIQNAENINKAVESLKSALKCKKDEIELFELFEYLTNICKYSQQPIVLIIDEIDSSTNNQVFLDFLSQLRGYYITRDETPTFQSVILAGVYDVKNMKHKIRPDEEHKTNSPWNIAVDFSIDMSFSPKDIASMLEEYEADYKTGMDIEVVANFIYEYTSGYPFLVTRICKLVDENIANSKQCPDRKKAWAKEGILQALKLLIIEKNTLFESLINKLEDYPELKKIIYSLLFTGNKIPYNPLNKSIEVAEIFGFIKKSEGNAVISNRIFETVLYNYFLSEEVMRSDMYKAALQDRNQFIQNGQLDMEYILERFVIHFDDLYGSQNERFIEDVGRRYFLLYLKPIINGVGNYYIEARTRNMERTDVIVDYNGEQFVIELKIWRGNSYNERGRQQLSDYLDYYHLKKGYMISFNFNKKKQIGVKKILFGDKILVEAVV